MLGDVKQPKKQETGGILILGPLFIRHLHLKTPCCEQHYFNYEFFAVVVGFAVWFYSLSASVHNVLQRDIFLWSFYPGNTSLLLVFLALMTFMKDE